MKQCDFGNCCASAQVQVRIVSHGAVTFGLPEGETRDWTRPMCKSCAEKAQLIYTDAGGFKTYVTEET